MKTLLAVRHAKSDWGDPSLSDHDRPLNKRGKRDAPRLGRYLRGEHLLPDLIITSTAKRARKTAEAIAKAGGYEGRIEASNALYGADPGACIGVLRGVPDSWGRVMIVGHNPGLQELVELLTSQAIDLPTATLVQIELPVESWQELAAETRGTAARVWRPRETDAS